MLILMACESSNISPTITATVVVSTDTLVSPTYTMTPSAIPTRTEVVDTRTPVPTLPADTADARVLELLKTNAGCTLPCWWGITPGVTRSDETQSILEPFLGAVVSEVRYGFTEDAGLLLMRPQPENGLRVEVQYLAKDNVVSMIYVNTAMTRDTYKMVYDDPFYQEIMSAYTLEAMLTKYGKPDQILIRSFSELAANNNPTQILLYYPKEGIVAQYFSRNGFEQKDSSFLNRTCPPKSHISLRLFKPDSGLSLTYVLSIDDNFSRYRDISESTNMTIDTFVQAYQAYDEKTLKSNCPADLKTPWNLWPGMYSN